MLQDFKIAARTLRKSGSFTTVAVLTLTLAIGANAAVFNLLNALLLRQLPVPDAHRLVQISTVVPGTERSGSLSFPTFQALGRDGGVFSQVIGTWGEGIQNVEANGQLTQASTWAVTASFYSELSVVPIAGRLLQPSDVNLATRDPQMVAVVGHRFWQRMFGANPGAIGTVLRLEGVPFTIVGIAQPGFKGFGLIGELDITIPLTAVPLITGRNLDALNNRESRWVDAVGKLKWDVTIEQARAYLASRWPAILAETVPERYDVAARDSFRALQLSLTSAKQGFEPYLRAKYGQALYIVLSIALLVLLLGAINLASLMLSRSTERMRDAAIRLALGASRWQLARHTFAEGLMLSALGAAGGLLFAEWASTGLASFILRQRIMPSGFNLEPDGRLLAFTAGLAVVTCLLLSAAAAWRTTRGDASWAVERSTRIVGEAGRLGRTLVALQIALSLVLLTCAGLLVHSLTKLQATKLGMRIDGVLGAQLFPRPGAYNRVKMDTYFPELVERVAAMPRVEKVAVAHFWPGAGFAPVALVSRPAAAPSDGVSSMLARVSPGYFTTMGIAVRQGREFAWSDRLDTERVAILSHTLAAKLFPNGDGLGQRIRIGTRAEHERILVAGIVDDARLGDRRDPTIAAVYLALLQEDQYTRQSNLLVRYKAGARANIADIRRTVESLGYESILYAHPLSEVASFAILQEQLTALLGAFFGGLALLVAAVGVYGLMSYTVAARIPEFGVRMALGALPSNIVLGVLREALAVTAIGAVGGLAAASLTGRVLQSWLFGISPHDLLTLSLAPVAVISIAMIAALLPAIRAARRDPMSALRAE